MAHEVTAICDRCGTRVDVPQPSRKGYVQWTAAPVVSIPRGWIDDNPWLWCSLACQIGVDGTVERSTTHEVR